MHRGVAARGPARAASQECGMIGAADVDAARRHGRALHLRMAAEAEVRVALREQLGVEGTVGIVACRAAFAQCLMLEHMQARLLTMTLGALFVEPRQREAATRRFTNIAAMRIVALDAVHAAFGQRMMMRQIKLRVRL